MTSVLVIAKRNDVVAPCPPHPQPDGHLWTCPWCEEVVIRVSFGVMNGTLQCVCGATIELIVGGKPVDPAELNVVHTPVEEELEPSAGPVNDAQFLRECGIAMEEK